MSLERGKDVTEVIVWLIPDQVRPVLTADEGDEECGSGSLIRRSLRRCWPCRLRTRVCSTRSQARPADHVVEQLSVPAVRRQACVLPLLEQRLRERVERLVAERRCYVGSGNEPWYANGWGNRSLTLPAGSSATSPSFCINLLDPSVRMFTRGSSGSHLRSRSFSGVNGNITGIFNFADRDGSGAWSPSDRVSSSLALPLLTSSAQIRVTAASGTWQVDDAFVDPWITGG